MLLYKQKFYEEFKVNLASCKLIVRCKTALVRLIKCSRETIEKSEFNLRQIVHHVDNWISNLEDFVVDILKLLILKYQRNYKIK